MKKLLVLAAVLLVLPVTLNASTVIFDGDAGMYGTFLESADVVAGETYCDLYSPANFGFLDNSSVRKRIPSVRISMMISAGRLRPPMMDLVKEKPGYSLPDHTGMDLKPVSLFHAKALSPAQ